MVSIWTVAGIVMEGGLGKYGVGIRDKILKKAAVDFRFLLSRGYPRGSALGFVGNHYQLSSLERNILFRAVFTRRVAAHRRSKLVKIGEITGQRLVIDGYNCIITLENALKGIPLVAADDGFVRDMGLVFRRFRQSERTKQAWGLISKVFSHYPPSSVYILLDAPYSGSGRLGATLNRWMAEAKIRGRATTAMRNEKAIGAMEGIKVSADSVIIDYSDRVFDLAGHIIRRLLKKRPMRF